MERSRVSPATVRPAILHVGKISCRKPAPGGEVARLKREAQDAAANLQQANVDLINAWSKVSPVKTLVATSVETLKWDQALLAGGWKTPDGNPALMIAAIIPTDDGRTITISSKFVEYYDEIAGRLGVSQYYWHGSDSMTGKTKVIAADEAASFIEESQNQTGVKTLFAPRVTTGDGIQARMSMLQQRSLPNGETYNEGLILDVVPIVSSDGQSVRLVMTSQTNLPIPRPSQTEPPKE